MSWLQNAWRVSGPSETPTSLTDSPSAHYTSPQTEEVVTTGEGRIGLLGDWREVPTPPPVWERGGVCFDDCSLFPLIVSFWLPFNVVTAVGDVDKPRLMGFHFSEMNPQSVQINRG